MLFISSTAQSIWLCLLFLLSFFHINSTEYPLNKTFLLSLENNVLNSDISPTIQLYSLQLNLQNIADRIKCLHYLSHQDDEHSQHLFDIIYSSDTKIMDSLARQLFNIKTPSIQDRIRLCQGNILRCHEYCPTDTNETILFLKYKKALDCIVDRPLLTQHTKKQKEEELRMREILKISSGNEELEITSLIDKSKKLKGIISGHTLSGPAKKLSFIVHDLLIRSCFSLKDTTSLFNCAILITAYENGKDKGLFLDQLVEKFIHKKITAVEKKESNFWDIFINFFYKQQENEIDDPCRFIVLFTLLLHHRFIPESYMVDYVDKLLLHTNEFFPTSIKPHQSLCGYIDHLHGEEYEPTALHYACKFKLFNLINLILSKDNISISLNKQNHEGKTPLMLLCKHYFPYDHFGTDDYLDSKYSLAKKIEVFIDIMKQCIEKGVDLSIRDNKGKTISHHIFAHIFGHYDARHGGDEADKQAVVKQLFFLLHFLEQYIPNFIYQEDNNNNTPFHFFIRSIATMKFSDINTIKLIYYFLSRNNNVSHPNKKSHTPLQLYLGSILNLNLDILCFLISQGAALYWPHTKIDYSEHSKGRPLFRSKLYKNQMPFKTIIEFRNNHAYTNKKEELYQPEIEQMIETHIKDKENEWEQLLGPISIDTKTFKKKTAEILKKETPSKSQERSIALLQYFSYLLKLFRLSFFFHC